MALLDQISNGRTDLVFEYLAAGHSSTGKEGDSILRTCAYFGDVSAIKYLLANGASLRPLGTNLDLNGACYHGHWRLCQFLIEQGARVNHAQRGTGETALHSALCKPDAPQYNLVVQILLAHGADPNRATKHAVETGAFMRDCRTKGETPLHRAAAFCDEEVIQMLLDAGAAKDAKDMNGDTPLSWASWYARPIPILRKLLYGDYWIRPDYGGGLGANLRGRPSV
jgi:uncharacterized protein